MSNNRSLRAYVRYANNKAVPGSLIVRNKAPKVGTWKEVDYDLCCGGSGNCCSNETTVTLSYTPEYTSFGGIVLRLYCNGEKVSEGFLDKITTSLTETIDWLNNAYGSTDPLYLPLLGTFSLSGEDTILLTLTECQYKRLCPEGELTFTLIQFP
jgi:hypothetical protein